MHLLPDLEALKQANVPNALAEFLGAINDKLDMIISMFSQENLLEDFPVEAEVVEISGAGMRFMSSTDIEPEQHVEIVMMLSRMPLRMAGAIGRITRVEETASDETLYGLDFTTIRDADLETVVQFVFQEQRARIREQKWNLTISTALDPRDILKSRHLFSFIFSKMLRSACLMPCPLLPLKYCRGYFFINFSERGNNVFQRRNGDQTFG